MTEPAIDLDFRPAHYWEAYETGDSQVEATVASVNWNGVITLHLLAGPVDGRIAYNYRCNGDCYDQGAGMVEYVTENTDRTKPLPLGLLADALESFFLAADSLEEALDIAWSAGRDSASNPYYMDDPDNR